MDDAHEPEPEHSPYLRLPWPFVAAGLVGVLLIALGAGLFANRYLRPQVSVQPTPIPPAAAAPAATNASAPTLVPTPTLVVAPRPLALATAAAPAATVVSVTAVATPTTLATPPAAVVTMIPTPSVHPTFDALSVAEIGKAYDDYWQVRGQALLELDKTHLDEVMAGDHLDSVAHLIDELSGEKRAIKTAVDHDFRVVQLVGDDAQIFDDYISDSVYVDPVTQQSLSEPTSDELRVVYRLRKADGKWKVVDSVHAD